MKTRRVLQRAVAEALDQRLLLSAVSAVSNGNREIYLGIYPNSTADTIEIDRSTDNYNFTPIYIGAAVTSYTDAGLTPNTAYAYNFVDTDSTGSYTSNAIATTGPNDPALGAAGNGASEIDLSITPDYNVSSMEIIRDTSEIFFGSPSGSFADTSLTADTTYGYVVITSNACGYSSASASATTGPSAPAVSAVAGGNSQIDLAIAPDSSATYMQIARNGSQIYAGAVLNSFADTGLSPDNSCTYVITTGNANGSASATASATTGIADPGFTAAGVSGSEIDLSLSSDFAATSMQILRDGSSIYSGAVVGTFADTGLLSDSSHAYTVITSKGASTSSSTNSGATGPCDPTISGAANSNGTQIDLTFTADASATSMEVLRDGSSIYTGGPISSFSDTNLSPDSSHSYAVIVSNANGSASASTSAGTAPSLPYLIATDNGPSEIDLTIGPDFNATSMQILQDGVQVYSGAIINTFGASGLAAGSAHTYTVNTANANGYSTSAATAVTGFPAPGLVLTSNGLEIDMAITPDANATSMQIFRNDTLIYTGAPITDFVDGNLPADSSFTYTATQSNSLTSASAAATAGTGPFSPGAAAVQSFNGEIDLTFTCDDSATALQVIRDGATIYSGIPIGVLADTGLTFNSAHSYTIVTSNANGSSSVTIGAASNSSTGVAATPNGAHEIDLSWSGSILTNTFLVQRSTDDSTWTPLPTVTGAAYDDTGLDGGIHYYYQVQAEMPDGSLSAPGFADASTALLAPDGLTANAISPGEIDLSWTSQSAPSTVFQIERNGVVIGQTAAGATTYQDTSVSEATGYAYQVIAMVSSVLSVASDPAFVSTPLAAPSGLTASAASANEIDLSWTNNSQATNSFVIYRSTDGNASSSFDPNSYSPLTQTPVSGTSYADMSAADATTYWYEVMAVLSSQGTVFPSQLSAPASASTTTAVEDL
ncbi:MAG TPA: hypothetical protein VFC46_10465, partial [Humisphaera sp.]|nr:hypothetical protein [Humisphaera sp.]